MSYFTKKGILIKLLALCLAIKVCESHYHFASLSGWGCGSNQGKIAELLKSEAETNPISLIVSPGNNFPNGISWDKCYKKPYESKALKVPFMPTLGQDDWENGNAIPLLNMHNATYKTEVDDYPKWTFPNYWYRFVGHYTDNSGVVTRRDGTVFFVFMDTYILSSAFPDAEIAKQAFDDLNATISFGKNYYDWTVVVGYKSLGGQHILDGGLKQVKKLLIDGKADLVLSGSSSSYSNSTESETTFINCGNLCLFKVDGSYLTPSSLVDGVMVTHDSIKTTLPSAMIGLQGLHGDELPSIQLVDIQYRNGAKGMSRDAFLRVVGTIGLVILVACIGSLVQKQK